MLAAGWTKTEAGMNVENSYNNEAGEDAVLSSVKSWDPVDLIDEMKFDVTLELYRKVGTGALVSTGVTVTLDGEVDAECTTLPCAYESEAWKATWLGLAKRDANGNIYDYSIMETNVLAAGWTKTEAGMNVENSYNNEDPDVLQDLVSNKNWEPTGLLDSMKFPVTFELFRYIGDDPETAVAVPLTLELDGTEDTPCADGAFNCAYEGPAWVANWMNVETTDAAGNTYHYIVKETSALNDGFSKLEEGMMVRNTYDNMDPAVIEDITAVKEWAPEGLLESMKYDVEFQLYRYTTDPDNPETVGDPVTLTAPDWNHTWADMPTTDTVGNPYTYYVIELTELEPGFSKLEEGMMVRNTYDNMDPAVIEDITAVKEWGPEGLLESMKYDVEFQLYRYTTDPDNPETVGDPVTLTAPDWNHTWADMPTTDTVGNPYTYYVIELTELGPGFSKLEEGMMVRNTYDNMDPAVIEDITAVKEWAPEGLLESMKYDVEFQLYRYTTDPNNPETVGDPVTLTAPDWNHTWADMPTTDTVGNPYTYYVIELTELEPGFSKLEEGMMVRNTYDNMDPAVIEEITAVKEWAPEGLLESMKYDVEFQLYRYTTDPDNPETVGDPVTLTAPDWNHTWADMPTTDTVGNPYTYYVKELTPLPDGFEKTEEGLTVTNVYNGVIEGLVVAEKVWVGGPATRPSVWFQLWRTWQDKGTTYREPVPGAEIKYLPNGVTTTAWTDIDADTATGILYTFYVKEVNADGEDFTAPNYQKVEEGLKITNTYVAPIMIDPLYVNKVWQGGQAPYPAIYIHLYRNIPGGSPEPVGAPFPLDGVADPGCVSFCEISPWRWVAHDLPLTDNLGNPYTYTVHETDASGNDYTPENYVKSVNGYTLTNTYASPKIDVTMNKVWSGGSGTRPTIQVQLYRNGVAFGSAVQLVHPNTTYTWKGLDKTDANGVVYRYTVDEVAVPAQYSKSIVGMTITNTYTGGTKPPDVPYTGDASHALLYGILAITSLAGFGATVAGKRRKKK